MNKIKSRLPLALMAIAVAAFAVPAAASASNWTKEGKEVTQANLEWTQGGNPVESNSSIALEGLMKFTGPVGGTECTVKESGFVSSGNSGHINSFEAPLGGCKPLGALAGCKLTSVTPAGFPWTISATETGGKVVARITDINVNYKYEGFLCPKEITVTGGLTATPNDSYKISSFSLSGELKASLGEKVTVSGSLGVSPAESYGISAGVISLGGSLGFHGPVGGITCSGITSKLSILPGSQGKLTSLGFDPGKCIPTGAYAGLCNASSVTPTGLPWSIQDEGTKIKISGFAFTMQFSGGKCTELKASGTMYATPDSTTAIKSTSFAGLLSTTWGAQEWTGPMSWTPAGVFGL
ncbi:MAG TPA: hypothetical protein VMR96_02810 [Solirubrobacterales bacterium]|nr:hypothetical protein [Solirubrobacterales bacterium]